MKTNDKFYQLKISLLNVEPPVWRRIVVPPDIALNDLHEVIQDVMGWSHDHLHSFIVGKKRSERKSYLPARGCDGPDDFPEDDYTLNELAHRAGMKFIYWYDFGDDWKHEITVEKTSYVDAKFPGEIRCLAGKGACPPDNCGGPYMYTRIVANWQAGEEVEDGFSFLGSMLKRGRFKPERFDINAAREKLQKTLKMRGLIPKRKESEVKDERRDVLQPVEAAPKEIVQNALLSPIEAIRLWAGIWFSGSDLADVSTMKTVIESVRRYGIKDSLSVLEDLILPQDETTVAWITGELDKDHDLEDVETDNYCWFLAEMLTRTDPKLLDKKMVRLRCFPEKLEETFLHRLELSRFDWDELWNLLTRRLKGDEDECPYDINLLREAMSRHGDRKQNILDVLLDRDGILKKLKRRESLRDDDVSDLKIFLLDLIGDMRITEALPYVLDALKVPPEGTQRRPKERIKLDEALDYYYDGDEDDDLVRALSRIVDDTTLERLFELWKNKPRRFYWFPDMLQKVNTSMAYGVAIVILKSEIPDGHDAGGLASNLLDRCVAKVYPLVPDLQMKVDEDTMFPEDSDLCYGFVVAKLIHPGKESDPDQDTCFEKWHRRLEKDNWGLDDYHEQMRTERKREGDFEDFEDDDEERFFF